MDDHASEPAFGSGFNFDSGRQRHWTGTATWDPAVTNGGTLRFALRSQLMVVPAALTALATGQDLGVLIQSAEICDHTLVVVFRSDTPAANGIQQVLDWLLMNVI